MCYTTGLLGSIGSPGFGIQWRISKMRSRSANIGSNTARLGVLIMAVNQ